MQELPAHSLYAKCWLWVSPAKRGRTRHPIDQWVPATSRWLYLFRDQDYFNNILPLHRLDWIGGCLECLPNRRLSGRRPMNVLTSVLTPTPLFPSTWTPRAAAWRAWPIWLPCASRTCLALPRRVTAVGEEVAPAAAEADPCINPWD